MCCPAASAEHTDTAGSPGSGDLYAMGYGAEQLSDIETKCASLALLDLAGQWLAQQSMGNTLSPVKRCPFCALSGQDLQLLSADRVWFCSLAISWQYIPGVEYCKTNFNVS